MQKNIEQFSKEDKKLAKELFFEGYSPHDIALLLEWPYYNTLFVLKRILEDFDVHEYLSFADITDKEILFLSDTHIGSKKENLDYVREAYKLAAYKGIKLAVHGGDLVQSTYAPVQKKYTDQYKQVEHVIEDYPKIPGFVTLIHFGNHDLNTFADNPELLKLLRQRKDLVVMGCKRAYITWLDKLISIYHSAPRYHLSIPNVDSFFKLRGHAHKLSVDKDGYFYLPSASDDMIQNINAKPGFIIGKQNNNFMTMESYHFEDGLYYDGPVLTKSIK